MKIEEVEKLIEIHKDNYMDTRLPSIALLQDEISLALNIPISERLYLMQNERKILLRLYLNILKLKSTAKGDT